jgi:plastocyanin
VSGSFPSDGRARAPQTQWWKRGALRRGADRLRAAVCVAAAVLMMSSMAPAQGAAVGADAAPAPPRFVRMRGVEREGDAASRVGRIEPSGAVTMGRYSVRAESGRGLWIVPDAGARTCHGDSASAGDAPGFLPLVGSVSALAVWGRTIFAATGSRGGASGAREASGLVVIDARRPGSPVIARRLPREDASPVVALDVIGPRLYLLTRKGLEILDTGRLGAPPQRHPEITGTGLRVAGRLLYVTRDDGSRAVYRDTTSAPLRWEVSVNEDFYSPQDLVIDVGDEVRWSNSSATSHNVVSCTADLKGCEGATSAEPFDSGDPALFFVFDHVFTQAGASPYACEPHPYMTGSVTVMGSAGSPPGVPDGVTGAPMTVQRLSADGSTLAISWDAGACSGAADFEILFGYPYGLPPATGSDYEPAGSRCGVGTLSPFTWQGSPTAFPGPSGLLWWLVVATDGAATEGSWGKTSSGSERGGPGAGGASLECGVVSKSLANPCGQ